MTIYHCFHCVMHPCHFEYKDGKYQHITIPRILDVPDALECLYPDLRAESVPWCPDQMLMTCPMCGTEASLWLNEIGECPVSKYYQVICDNDDCGVETCLHDTPISAIRAWNQTVLRREWKGIKKVNF